MKKEDTVIQTTDTQAVAHTTDARDIETDAPLRRGDPMWSPDRCVHTVAHINDKRNVKTVSAIPNHYP